MSPHLSPGQGSGRTLSCPAPPLWFDLHSHCASWCQRQPQHLHYLRDNHLSVHPKSLFNELWRNVYWSRALCLQSSHCNQSDDYWCTFWDVVVCIFPLSFVTTTRFLPSIHLCGSTLTFRALASCESLDLSHAHRRLRDTSSHVMACGGTLVSHYKLGSTSDNRVRYLKYKSQQ